ncbi:MAG: diguanylate cyclase [Oscillospiraceae bacterium]|nr:diguanylate cyclase [Oscillospiraceae bacterium]
MNSTREAFSQIVSALARNYDSLFYVDISTCSYIQYSPSGLFDGLAIPTSGSDFFTDSKKYSAKFIHPDDLAHVTRLFDRDAMLERLENNNIFTAVYRFILNGRIIHMRHSEIMCDDKMHIMFCLENIEDDYRRNKEQQRDLQSARRMARLDVLTGIRNKNAFSEYSALLDSKIQNLHDTMHFGIVMCDLNDLKKINDTRGHSFGDEAIQRASRLICDIFDHSPVFRTGGDEFVVILDGRDFDERDTLLKKLRDESLSNQHSRSGPVVACGMSVYDPASDKCFDDVFNRADKSMYENKHELKNNVQISRLHNTEGPLQQITPERKRILDSMFGAMYTLVGEGYIYLNDMRYDYSRWSLPLIVDFGLQSEYMYNAGSIWQEHIHPDDLTVYRDAVDTIFKGNAEIKPIHYRARRPDGTYAVCSTRGFVLMDSNGAPEYFGGIILTD